MSNNKNPSDENFFAQALLHHQNNNLELAINLYNKVLKINPIHYPAHNNLGVAYQKLGLLHKAKDCYKKLIEINPNDASACSNLGVLFKDLNDYDNGIKSLAKAIEINPHYSEAHNNLGNIFYEIKDFKKAKIYYEKAIEINPNYATAQNNLGLIFTQQQEIEKAKNCYEKAIKINPNYIKAYNNLATSFSNLKDYQGAINCFDKLIEIDTNNSYSINNLKNFLSSINFDNLTKSNSTTYKKLILFLYRKKNINHTKILRNAISMLLVDNTESKIEAIFNSQSFLTTNEIIQNLLKDELFHLILQKSLIADKFLEKLITKIRSEILFTLDTPNNNLKYFLDFIISLAEQCWLNEYIYSESDKEISVIIKLKKKIESDNEINELDIAILGCYIPLNSSKIIEQKLLNYKSTNILFNDLITVQINEILKETELRHSIESLDKIADPVSNKVREQYEVNPYPRWRYTDALPTETFLNLINESISPNLIDYTDKFNNPSVLIAGCGTGSHPISSHRYKGANIVAIDLSLSSLAYAKRKTEELGLKNIEYLHADILQLKKLNKKFDIIESAGTLHHLKDPISGLKVLLDILQPHGFMKLGLYSETARQDIVNIREFIKNKNYKNTKQDIKACRNIILNNNKKLLSIPYLEATDFYSISGVRDLLFHVQEHRFTIPEISKILKDLKLEFLGFSSPSLSVKKKYSKLFFNDKKNISLDNWHKFEIDNPDTFINMYQFWVRKI